MSFTCTSRFPDENFDRHGERRAAPATMHCDQCEMLAINGVPCHETGCPNSRARWDAASAEWVPQTKCFECGCMVDCDGRGRYECDCQDQSEELDV